MALADRLGGEEEVTGGERGVDTAVGRTVRRHGYGRRGAGHGGREEDVGVKPTRKEARSAINLKGAGDPRHRLARHRAISRTPAARHSLAPGGYARARLSPLEFSNSIHAHSIVR